MITQLTENVFIQDEASAGEVDEFARLAAGCADLAQNADLAKLTHAVNFYAAGSKESRVQELTAESMVRARADNLSIRLVAIVQAGEERVVPAHFVRSRPLDRVAADLRAFDVPRPLPLLFDILERAAECADADGYLIFTNSDICVNPKFYAAAQSLLRAGADALIINRRTVGALESYGPAPESAAMEDGTKHPGFDCFVFPVAWVRGFLRADSCVGVGWVMRPLLYNLVAVANRLLILRDARLSYHYGDDAYWRDPRFADYLEHNLSETKRVYQALLDGPGARRRRIEGFARAHNEPVVAQNASIIAKARRWFNFLAP